MSRLALVRPAGAALVLMLVAAVPAHAAPSREEIDGRVLHLVSVQDEAAMTSMSPGETVTWDVRVSADEPDGEIAVTLAALDGDGFQVSVAACTGQAQGCTSQLLAPTVLEGVAPVATQSADETVWYRIRVTLTGYDPARTVLTFSAHGHGEQVSTDGVAQLPGTGTSPWLPVGLALAALLFGVVLARLAGMVRPKAVRR